MKKTLSIIIITYNNQHQIADCLQSVFENFKRLSRTESSYQEGNIIVIDNNSKDETLRHIEKISNQHKNISLLKNNQNTGFAKAVNQGIKFAQEKFKSDFHFLLNPDAVLKEDCLEKMICHSREGGDLEFSEGKFESLGLVSPVIINPQTNQSWFAGAKINWLKFKTEHSKNQTDYLTGCALLIPKKIIEKIGFFDERFFLYYEDADFSLRARKAGFDLKIVPEAICFHEESQSSTSETKDYYLVKSGLIFFHKHYLKFTLPYFWVAFYSRLFYHEFIAKKKEVLKSFKNFLEEVKNNGQQKK